MKIASVEFGQITWLVNLTTPHGDIYFPELAAKLVKRYAFLKFPRAEELLESQQARVFEHGKFGDYVIRKFSIYSDGLVAETKAGTEAAGEFLDDFMAWIAREFGAKILDIGDDHRVFDSHIVAQLDIDLSEQMKFSDLITNQIHTSIKGYDIPPRRYVPSGFLLDYDSHELNGLSTSSFRLERRTQQPYSRHIYFSAAPLQTEDHKKLLLRIERSM